MSNLMLTFLYKEKTRENLSCYVKICYNYSNRGFVKGEVGDGRI